MADSVKTSLEFTIDKAALRRDLADAVSSIKATFAGIKFPSAAPTSKAPQIPGLPPLDVVKKATAAMADMDKKLADVRVKYAKDAGKLIISDLKHLQDESAKLRNAEIASVDKSVKAELKLRRNAIDEEKRLLTQVARDKDAVNRKGVGAPAGILGTGRNILNNLPGAGSLGKIAGAVGIGAAMKEVIDIGRSYESSLAELSALTGVTGDKLQAIGKNARELGKTFGVDASQGIESYKLALSSLGPGLATDAKALAEFGRLGTTLSKATRDDLGTSMTAIVGVMNQAGLATGSYADQARQAAYVTNTLAAAAKVGNAEVPDLSEGFKAVGKTATDAGLDVTGTAAALETLASFQIKGAEGGTQFRNILLKMSAGSQESTDSLKQMGLTFADINPEKVGLNKGLENLKAGFERIKDPVQRAAAMKHIFGLETSTAAGALLNSTEKLKDYEKEIRKAASDKEAEKQAAIRMQTFDGSLSRFIANLKDIGISVFTAMQPALTAIFEIIGRLSPVFVTIGSVLGSTMTAIMPTVTRLVDILVSGLGPVLESISSLLVPLATMIGQVLTPVLDLLAGIMPVIVDLFKELSVALQPVISTIGELVSGILTAFAGQLQQQYVAVVPLISAILKLGLAFVPILLKADLFLPMMAAMAMAMTLVMKAVTPLLQGLTWLVGKIADGVAWVAKLMPSLYTLKDKAVVPLSGAAGFLSKTLSTTWAVVSGGVTSVTALLTPIFAAIKATAAWMINLLGLSGVFRTVLGWIGEFASGIGSAINAVGQFIGLTNSKAGGTGSFLAGAVGTKKGVTAGIGGNAGNVSAALGLSRTPAISLPTLGGGTESAGGGAGGSGKKAGGGKDGKSPEDLRKEQYDAAITAIERLLAAEQHVIDVALARGEIKDEEAKLRKLRLDIKYDRFRLLAAIKFRQDYASIVRDAELHDISEANLRHEAGLQRVKDEEEILELLRDIGEKNADLTAALTQKQFDQMLADESRKADELAAFTDRLAKRREAAANPPENKAREDAIKAEQARRDRVLQLEAAGKRVPDQLRKPIPIPVELQGKDGRDIQGALLDAINSTGDAIRNPINAVATMFDPVLDRLGIVGTTVKSVFGESAKIVGDFATQFINGWGKMAVEFVASKQKMIVAWLAEKAQAGITATAVWAYEGLKSSAFVQSAAAATVAAGEWIAAQASVAASAVASAAVWVGAQLSAAAASIGSAVASVISWIASLIPWPLSLALIPAGIAGIYGLWKGAQALFAPKKQFAQGGIVDKPLFSPFMGGAVAGEAGPEAIVPLSALVKLISEGVRTGIVASIEPSGAGNTRLIMPGKGKPTDKRANVTAIIDYMVAASGGLGGINAGIVASIEPSGGGRIVSDYAARGGYTRSGLESARDMAEIRQALQSPQFVTVLDQNRNIISMKRTEQLNLQGVL